jgi:acetolactate synthase-1/2/3 large subunit
MGAARKRNGADAMVEQLRREGVDVIFGLPGDQLMVALDSLYDEPGIRFITTRHEQGTTYMADGYARVGGRPGTAMVVPGVGVYNAASGLATAYATSSPVLLLAGQVNRHGIGKDLGLLHDVHDQLDIVRPITKWAERVTDADRIPGALREAFHQMCSGRPRPVEVEIPPETFADATDAPAIDPTPDAGDRPRRARASGERALGGQPLVIMTVVSCSAMQQPSRQVAEFLQAVVTTRGQGRVDDRNPPPSARCGQPAPSGARRRRRCSRRRRAPAAVHFAPARIAHRRRSRRDRPQRSGRVGSSATPSRRSRCTSCSQVASPRPACERPA